jgi:hypothetical protein
MRLHRLNTLSFRPSIKKQCLITLITQTLAARNFNKYFPFLLFYASCLRNILVVKGFQFSCDSALPGRQLEMNGFMYWVEEGKHVSMRRLKEETMSTECWKPLKTRLGRLVESFYSDKFLISNGLQSYRGIICGLEITLQEN